MYIKCLAQCSVHSMLSININCKIITNFILIVIFALTLFLGFIIFPALEFEHVVHIGHCFDQHSDYSLQEKKCGL